MNNFNIELLRVFLTVSKFNNFSQAANFLYLDQSTVSKKIRQLEKAFHISLFIRTSQGVQLSPAGYDFKQKAIKIMDAYNDLAQTEISLADIRLGILDNIAAYHYSEFLRDNLDSMRQVKISDKGVDLIDAFNNGILDSIIVNEDSIDQITGEFLSTTLTKESFGLLTSKPKSPEELSITDLDNRQLLIAPEYCPVGRQLRQLLNGRQFTEVGYTNTLLELVANSTYATIMPWKMIQNITQNQSRFSASRLIDFPARKIALFTREKSIQELLLSSL